MHLHNLKTFSLSFLVLYGSVLFSDTPASSIKSNGTIIYNKPQADVGSFKDMFSEGNFYGRLRNNNFYFTYQTEDSGHELHLVSAFGASLV